MAKHTATWKKSELAVASRLGGRRLGATGMATCDVDAGWCAVEVKHRKSLPDWLHSAMAQIVAAASSTQLPVVVLHEAGRRHDGDVVCLRMKDFEEWFGKVNVDGENEATS